MPGVRAWFFFSNTTGRPHRSVPGRSKLSVFDAMADFDLAVEQEEWNDFADESTAPPPSPAPAPSQPLPSTAPTVTAETPILSSFPFDAATEAEGALAGQHESLSQNGLANLLQGGSSPKPPRWLSDDVEVDPSGPMPPAAPSPTNTASPDSVAAVVADAPLMPPTPGGGSESQDEEWGDFAEADEEIEAGFEASTTFAIGGEGAEGGERVESDIVVSGSIDVDEAGSAAPVDLSRNDRVCVEPLRESSAAGRDAVLPGESDGVAGAGGTPPEIPEFVGDPFANVSPPTSPVRALLSSPRSPGDDEQPPLVVEEGEGTEDLQVQVTASCVNGLGRIVTSSSLSAAAVGVEDGCGGGGSSVPLSLRALRDGLAARGQLELALEVQRKMEQPVADRSRRILKQRSNVDMGSAVEVVGKRHGQVGETADEGEKEEEEARDLERWRAAMQLPPAVTLEAMATAFASDAERVERFRGALVSGSPPVEDEAVAAGGGSVSLGKALRRQRAARRAVRLSGALNKTASMERGGEAGVAGKGEPAEGVTDEPELELDLGMGTRGGGKPPPALTDWADMVAYVDRMAKVGLTALSRQDGDCPPHAAKSADTEDVTSPAGGGDGGIGLEVEGRGGGEAVSDGSIASPFSPSESVADAGGGVPGEVVRSPRFEAFARGLREGVRVCRLLQATAEDALETIEGFNSMEDTWQEFLRRAREATVRVEESTAATGKAEQPEAVAGKETGDWMGLVGNGGVGDICFGRSEERGAPEGYVHSSVEGRGFSGGDAVGSDEWSSVVPSVKDVRDAAIACPADSELCAVCLQPLEGRCAVDRTASPAAASLNVIEYCGVRYFACAVNFWVNVLDKAPPGAISTSAP